MKRLFSLIPVLLLAAPVEAQLRTTSTSELETLVKSLQSQVNSLQSQVTNLQSQVTSLQSQANTNVGFTKSGSTYTLDAGTGAVIIKGYTLSLEGSTSATIKSTSTSIEGAASLALKSSSSAILQAGSTLDLKGSLIKLNGGAKPILASPATGSSPAGPVAIHPQASTVFVP